MQLQQQNQTTCYQYQLADTLATGNVEFSFKCGVAMENEIYSIVTNRILTRGVTNFTLW